MGNTVAVPCQRRVFSSPGRARLSAAGVAHPDTASSRGNRLASLEVSMPDASASVPTLIDGRARSRARRNYSLCPVCEGAGDVQVASGDWSECRVCGGGGMVPDVDRAVIAPMPCEWCLGAGAWESGELCGLCGGCGTVALDLSPVRARQALAA